MTERYSVNVLRECIDLQNKKANDYQNPNSTIKQADYYPSGCLTILEIIQAKVLRMRSVMEAMQNDPNYKPNFESLEDSAKDLINYASFFVSYSRGKIDGQEADRDFLNRKVSTSLVEKTVEAITRSERPSGYIYNKKVSAEFPDIEDIWKQELPSFPDTTLGPVDKIESHGFIGEVGDSGRATHPGVTADLRETRVDPRDWSIGARGAGR